QTLAAGDLAFDLHRIPDQCTVHEISILPDWFVRSPYHPDGNFLILAEMDPLRKSQTPGDSQNVHTARNTLALARIFPMGGGHAPEGGRVWQFPSRSAARLQF